MGKKSFLQRIGVVKDEEPLPSSPEVKSTNKPVVSETAVTPITGGQNYNEHLDNLMKDNNIPGPDFYEFSSAVDKAKLELPLSEQQIYATTFSTFSTMGVTSKHLQETGEKYLDLLRTEEQDFANSIAAAEKEQIQDRQDEIDTTRQEVEELTKQIQVKNARMNELNIAINQSKLQLTNEKQLFANALTNKVTSINNHITNIKQYLPYVKPE